MVVIMLTELACYSFLCKHFAITKDQVRYGRLTLRLDDYKKEVPALIALIEPHSDSDRDWGPAKRTLPELRNRYEQMLVTLRDLEDAHRSTPSGHHHSHAKKNQ
jgi:hypothetical protein